LQIYCYCAPMRQVSLIPKPSLISADETSLILRLDFSQTPPRTATIKLQYKEPREPWELAKEIIVKKDLPSIVDLKPGTAYFVRIALETDEGVECGEEGVFDTVPIGCTPKRKKSCIIS
jgi:hypothetical protein